MRGIATYLYELPDWPTWRWDDNVVREPLTSVRHHQGRFVGRMGEMGFELIQGAVVEALTADVVKSSEIEGEFLNVDSVRTSIGRHLGMKVGGLLEPDRDVEGIVKMTLDATLHFDHPLSTERLWEWHRLLFPAKHKKSRWLTVGAWRTDEEGRMQVVSGPIGKEKIHFIAPPATDVGREMDRLIEWVNSAPLDNVMKAAIAHLWFVTVHPFDDGNGRIGRALADMLLTRADGLPRRCYSMSSQIRLERKAYYAMLEQSEQASMDITPWLVWFLDCLDHSLGRAEQSLAHVLDIARFWRRHTGVPLNTRQSDIIKRLQGEFRGLLTSEKWAKLSRCSHDTALRDIEDLIGKGILAKSAAGGRSTHYTLVGLPDDPGPFVSPEDETD